MFALTRLSRPFYRFCTIRFTNDHEWIRLKDQVAKVGITDYAQRELGDIVHIEMPKVGLKFQKHGSVAAIESVKVAADIYAPVAGEVSAINDEVKTNPFLVNENAEKHWIFEAKISDQKEVDSLMTREQYEAFLKTLTPH